jgi:hypothetical protein
MPIPSVYHAWSNLRTSTDPGRHPDAGLVPPILAHVGRIDLSRFKLCDEWPDASSAAEEHQHISFARKPID